MIFSRRAAWTSTIWRVRSERFWSAECAYTTSPAATMTVMSRGKAILVMNLALLKNLTDGSISCALEEIHLPVQ